MPGELTLMPRPARLQREGGRLPVRDGFRVSVRGEGGERVLPAAARAVGRITRRAGLAHDPSRVCRDGRAGDVDLVVVAERPARAPARGEESYRLRVAPGGARLEAPTDLGARRGLQTLLQLLTVDPEGPHLPAVTIRDRPRFAWRGLMLDVVRHFLPVPVIRRNLEAMARVKLNVLHLHLTDDQGFRVESARWPRLHREASDGRYYSREQIREIVDFAAARGIRVVPEFDVPGHATSWLVAYPEHACGPPPAGLERGFGIFSHTFHPGRDATYRFLGAFLEEMAGLFPDEHVHLGGDEVRGGRWREDPGVRRFAAEEGLAGAAEIQARFLDRLTRRLEALGKTPVVWEGLADGLPRGTVVQAWKGRRALERAVRRGQAAILSRGYYLDLMRPAERHYRVDPLPARRHTSPEERSRVLGGEAAMWSEHVDARTVDSRVWPRAAAVAERLWSPAPVTDTGDMYRRLEAVADRLEALGLRHRSGPLEILRALAGEEAGERVDALRLLAGVTAPVEGLRWVRSSRSYTVHTPLDRFADAAVPDPRRARRFRAAVDGYLASPRDERDPASLSSELVAWRGAATVLRDLAGDRSAAAELGPLAEGLEVLARWGLVALEEGLRGGVPSRKVRQARREIRGTRAPRADVRFRVVHGVTRLMDDAAAGPAGG